MDRETKLPVPSRTSKNINCPINSDSGSSFSSSFSSSSPPNFLRHVQAAFKRHRPVGTMQSHSIRPRRVVVPQRDPTQSSASQSGIVAETKKSQDVVSFSQCHPVKDLTVQTRRTVPIAGETQEDASITPPSTLGTMTKSFDGSFNELYAQRDELKLATDSQARNPMSSLHVGSQPADNQEVVQFSIGSKKTSQGAHRMATGLDNLSSHMGSLALTEMDWLAGSQGEASIVLNDEPKNQIFQNAESDMNLKHDGASLAPRKPALQDQMLRFRSFLSQPVTQSSVVGPSCATTTSVHSTSAPMLNSSTYYSKSYSGSQVVVEPLGDLMHSRPVGSIGKEICGNVVNVTAIAAQVPNSAINTKIEAKVYVVSKEQKGSLPKEIDIPKNTSILDDKLAEEKGFPGDVTDGQSRSCLPKNLTKDAKLETSKSDKQENVASNKVVSAPRKRNYDPDLFFKVNGKLYQRLGKIGSGGSSEVHKVISSDCTIYALKKIKLKGRDYATAYGFCQEIVYLNKLKGQDNIIQLVDYEVTDKTLLQEVLNGSMSYKDAKVKDDGYIYMVLEYGEIDLAHMLSQKWKEIDSRTDSSNQTIDENWLRFYWQQILQAVNTIHEERIVHSDLKPANFLLVKGSLKLIDFGIAKAIMSDTTNIQRDSQVGTLSYMSPEAFMCNESDANGNTIKCGRPSDIWSLGCILYQMVYGRTPFSEYKTFWAKFKVITDPNHEIKYEEVSNPWLLDLMKKCLAWDRNERWRIPQLLQHPFLVPPVPPQLSLSQEQTSRLLQLISESCANNEEATKLRSQLQQLLRVPVKPMTSLLITSGDHQSDLFPQISKIHLQLQKDLENHKRN